MARADFDGAGGRRKGDQMKKEQEVKVKVDLTPGHEKRYTAACLEIIKRREIRKEGVSA